MRTAATTPLLRRARTAQSGFTILELLIAMSISIAVIAMIIVLFQHSGKIARAQTFVADMQDALRKGQQEMIRVTRMAGRGGLPLGTLPHGIALAVRNDTPAAGDRHHIAVGDTSSPAVLAGTDVLIVRGVIGTPVYQSTPLGADFSLDDPADPQSGSIRLFDPHPTSGIPQDLEILVRELASDDHPALLLVSPLDVWAVVEVDVAASDLSASPDQVTLAFHVGRATGSGVADQYAKLSGGFPAELRNVSHVGLLEERRFYIREEYERPGDVTSLLVPRLAELRFYPNTQLAHSANSDFNSEIADNILDLQVTLGVDVDGDGIVAEGADDAARASDEWLFNVAGDVDASGEPLSPLIWNPANATLHYVRISTLARTDRPDLGYQAEELVRIEDRDFSASPHRLNEVAERRFRRRILSTLVDMRNL
ncbi:MAG TPA: PilW family protein [Thermoanaerobaculia bacterium]|nr:PilW family protein [Thermoanaerobaculia bacterium]